MILRCPSCARCFHIKSFNKHVLGIRHCILEGGGDDNTIQDYNRLKSSLYLKCKRRSRNDFMDTNWTILNNEIHDIVQKLLAIVHRYLKKYYRYHDLVDVIGECYIET